MTDLEINIAIAEAMPRCKICGWKATVGHRCSHSPDYCHDLNAMHEVWSGLSETEKAVFVDELYAVTPSASYEDRYIGAIARQRAEAFLRTIGKWKP